MDVDTITLPEPLIAGDSLAATASATAFLPADGWSASMVVVGGSFRASVAGSTEGEGWRFAFSAATTAAWAAGTYDVFVVVSRASERYTLNAQRLTVKPDPLAATLTNFDARGSAAKRLAALELAYAAWIDGGKPGVAEYNIAGRVMKFQSVEDWIKAIEFARRDAATERTAERIAAGLGAGNSCVVRM